MTGFKSKKAMIMGTNLCKELFLSKPETMTLRAFYAPYILKYKFSRAKWYAAEYDWLNYSEVSEWCRQQFGPHDQNPDAWSRWNHPYEGKIYFRDEKDYVLFVLRWGA